MTERTHANSKALTKSKKMISMNNLKETSDNMSTRISTFQGKVNTKQSEKYRTNMLIVEDTPRNSIMNNNQHRVADSA
jgi:hypothetical protein